MWARPRRLIQDHHVFTRSMHTEISFRTYINMNIKIIMQPTLNRRVIEIINIVRNAVTRRRRGNPCRREHFARAVPLVRRRIILICLRCRTHNNNNVLDRRTRFGTAGRRAHAFPAVSRPPLSHPPRSDRSGRGSRGARSVPSRTRSTVHACHTVTVSTATAYFSPRAKIRNVRITPRDFTPPIVPLSLSPVAFFDSCVRFQGGAAWKQNIFIYVCKKNNDEIVFVWNFYFVFFTSAREHASGAPAHGEDSTPVRLYDHTTWRSTPTRSNRTVTRTRREVLVDQSRFSSPLIPVSRRHDPGTALRNFICVLRRAPRVRKKRKSWNS